MDRSVILGLPIAVILFIALSCPVLSQCDQPFIGDGVEVLYYNEGMDPTRSPNSLVKIDSIRLDGGTRVISRTHCSITTDTCLYRSTTYVDSNGFVYYGQSAFEAGNEYLQLCLPIDSVLVKGNVLWKRVEDRWTVLFGDYRPFKTFLSWTITSFGDTIPNYDLLVSDTFGIVLRYSPENGQVIERLVAAVINGRHYGNPVSVEDEVPTGGVPLISTDSESILVASNGSDIDKELEVTVTDYSGRVFHSLTFRDHARLKITDTAASILFISIRDVLTRRQIASRVLLNPRRN